MLTEPNSVDVHVGSRVRARRLMLQMSEDWLAGMLEVSLAKLEEMEVGTLRIDHATLMRLCDYLDVPERYFYMTFAGGGPGTKKRMRWVRDVDRWFAQHVFPHEGLFYGAALRLTGDSDDARELMHEAYADVLNGDKWTAIAFPRAYVLKAIRSLAGRRQQRSRIVRFDYLANLDVLNKCDAGPDGFELVSAMERRNIVLAAIDELPPQCRKVVKLRRLKEMLPREIANEMGISLSMVEKHLAKGMLHIANRLGEPRAIGEGREAADGRRDAAGSE
jgi:RNA polymerase sigma-70 factor (ECF subfamily)